MWRVPEVYVEISPGAMGLRSYIVGRGLSEIVKITTEVYFAVVKFVLKKIFTSVFTLIHRVSGNCCVTVSWVWIRRGWRWWGRVEGWRRRVEMGVGRDGAEAVKIRKILRSVERSIFEWRGRGRRIYGTDGGFHMRRIYADVIGRFGGGSRAQFCHCGRVWVCFAVDVTNFNFVGCDFFCFFYRG